MELTQGLVLTILAAACITAVPPSVLGWLAYGQVLKNRDDIERIHKTINSRMDQLLLLAASEASANATLAEKAAEHDRQDAKDEK